MREIKFRAWNSIDKCFCDNLTTLTNLRGFIKSKHYHPMQFTGLKDKNGVEIYEGDIVACDKLVVPLEVYYAEDLGMFRLGLHEDDCGDFVEFDLSDFEVIGNIHQNPELLED